MKIIYDLKIFRGQMKTKQNYEGPKRTKMNQM